MSPSPVFCCTFVILAFVAWTASAYPSVDYSTFNDSATTTVELVRFDDYDRLIKESGLFPLEESVDSGFKDATGLISVSRSRNVTPLRYTFGTHDPKSSDDYLVSRGSGMRGSTNAEDMLLKLKYPSRGFAANVSYLEIDVDQSSKDGRAYIASGGIDQRQIEIYIEASKTNFIKYSYKVFGKY